MSAIGNMFKNVGGFVSRYSPQILVGAGIAMSVGAVVTAVRAAIKTQPAVDEAKEEIVTIHKAIDDGKVDKKEGKKDLAVVYKNTGLELAKHYSLPVGLTVGSIGCTLSGFGILNKRFSGVSLAFTGLAASYDAYRKRVAAAYGDETENDLYLGLKNVTVKENEVNPDTGEVKKVKKTIKVKDTDEMDPFEIEFDGGPNYEKDVNFNEMFVSAQEKLAQIAHTNSKVPMFLDEVLSKYYLNLPVKNERLLQMMHHVGWPVGVTPAFNPHIIYDIDEDGVRTAKLMLHFTGMTANPWVSPYPKEIN